MKPNIKKMWIKRLRSGRYTQGRTYLNNEGQFCCLGVLCDLAVDAGAVPAPVGSAPASYCGKRGNLPLAVVRWAGLGDPYGNFTDAYGSHSSLSDLNDSGTSFRDIADIIEKHF